MIIKTWVNYVERTSFIPLKKYILCLLLNKEPGFHYGYFLTFLGKEAVPNKSMLSALQFSISLLEKNKEPVLNDQEKKNNFLLEN